MNPATDEAPEEIKARGAFYTPEALTHFLVDWGVRSRDDRVLEPSCGDGAFVSALAARSRALGGRASARNLIGVEREPPEAQKARTLAPDADIRALDFFDLEPTEVVPVDAAIGNPPYIRYHGFTGVDRDKALRRARLQGVELTRLASSWAHFTVHAAAFLKPTGRLALVLPAELLHTDYGRPVRDFLLRRLLLWWSSRSIGWSFPRPRWMPCCFWPPTMAPRAAGRAGRRCGLTRRHRHRRPQGRQGPPCREVERRGPRRFRCRLPARTSGPRGSASG